MRTLIPKNIEKVFHLPRADQYIRLTYHQAERWYREHGEEASEIIQLSYLIEKNPLECKARKVDMIMSYMKDDIEYSIVLLGRVMWLLILGYFNKWMVHFIETIKTTKISIDWASILNENLDEQLVVVKNNQKFYMTSYLV